MDSLEKFIKEKDDNHDYKVIRGYVDPGENYDQLTKLAKIVEAELKRLHERLDKE